MNRKIDILSHLVKTQIVRKFTLMKNKPSEDIQSWNTFTGKNTESGDL